jgi:hypothetical protein
MKLFRVIILFSSIIFLNACSTHMSSTGDLAETRGTFLNADMPRPLFLGEGYQYSLASLPFKRWQYLEFNLNKEEKNLHKQAVYHSLGTTMNGQVTSWYSKTRNVGGKVRVIHSYNMGSRQCRTYQAWIQVNGKNRHTTNNACVMYPSKTWSFYK